MQICKQGGKRGAQRAFTERTLAISLAVALQIMHLQRARAEDQVGYRYENYTEDDNRMEVQTHAALFDVTLKEGLIAIKGELVHDALSGATPTGAAPPAQYNYDTVPLFGYQLEIAGTNNTSVPLQHMDDERDSASLEVPITLGLHSITPQFSYSEEGDYISKGAALNYALSLNEKNTTLMFGWAHSCDRIAYRGAWQDKRSDDFLAGVNQLLGPKTVLGVNFTYGMAEGYLNDPYKFIVGAGDLQLVPGDPSGVPEKRPDYRNKFIARVSVTQFITPANASVETAYRFYTDSYGIDAHMIELTWYQKIGKHVVIAPTFRYYRQSAADFYYEILPGAPLSDPNYVYPSSYSPDYRLSELESYTAGVNVAVKVTKWLTFDAAYKRYVMEGLDNVTSDTAYPSANVFTVGARIYF